MGSGFSTWLLFLASWIGFRADLRTTAVVLVGGCAACLVVWRLSRNRPRAAIGLQEPTGPSGDPSDRVWHLVLGAIVALLVATNLLISLLRSYSVWDGAAIWSVKGYGIALEGTVLAGKTWGAHGLAYPLNIPLQIALFELAGGDLVPGSKAVFSLFFASLLLGVYDFLRGHGLTRSVAAVGVLCMATMPVLFAESTTGYANAPMVTYLVLGAFAIVDGGRRSSKGELLIGGLLLGFAAWTRIEGALYVAAILIGGSALLAARHRSPSAVTWAWAVVPLAVLVLPWLGFYQLFGVGTSQAAGSLSAAWREILAGEFRLGALRLVLEQTGRAFVDLKTWGWVWVLPCAVAAFAYRRAPPEERESFLAAAAMSLGTLIVTVLLFYGGSFGGSDLRGWLSRSYDRALMVSPALLLGGSLVLLSFRRRSDAA
jgi:hypothetical protein